MPTDAHFELEMVRLMLDVSLAHLDAAVQTMVHDKLRPILTVPLARQEIVSARAKLDAMLAQESKQ